MEEIGAKVVILEMKLLENKCSTLITCVDVEGNIEKGV